MIRELKALANTAMTGIYPENIYCICCGDTMDSSRLHGICDVCASRMTWATANPFSSYMDEFAFDDVWPCARYGFYTRRIMNSLKLSGRTYIARALGGLMAERILMEDSVFDGILAVPMYKDKERKRGYNQAELLAEYTARSYRALNGDVYGFGHPEEYMKSALVKTRPTGSMRMADAVSRRRMLDDAFAVSKTSEERLNGKHVLLVDDVVTTGSTADACARALKAAGVSRVTLICFAASAGYRRPDEE